MAESDPRIIRASGLAQGAAPVRAAEHAALRAAPEGDLRSDWQEPHEHGPYETSPDVSGESGHNAGDPLVMEARQRIVGLRPAEALGRDGEAPRLRPEPYVDRPLEGNVDPDRRPVAARQGGSRVPLLAALLAVLAIGGGAVWYLQSGGIAPSEAPVAAAAGEATEEPQRPLVPSDTLTASPAPAEAVQPVRRVDQPPAAGAADPSGGPPAMAGAPEPMQPNRVRTVAVQPGSVGDPAQPELGASATTETPPDGPAVPGRLVPVRVRTTAIDGTGLPPAIEPEPLARAPQPLPASPPAAGAQALAPSAPPGGASNGGLDATGTPAPAPPFEPRLPRPRPVF